MKKWGNSYLVAAVICLLLMSLSPYFLQQSATAVDEEAGNSGLVSANDPDRLQAYLYFAESRYRFLKAEIRPFPLAEDPVSVCRWLVEALIGGPIGDLVATIPKGTRVTDIAADGCKLTTGWYFIDDLSWIPTYDDGTKMHGLIHDATYYGITVDSRDVEEI